MKIDPVAAVAEVLGKPAAFDMSEPAVKVRKTLMAVSIALLCIVAAKIEPGDSFTIFGLNLKGVTADKIIYGGIIALVYSLIHFIVYIAELVMESRIRITGTFQAFRKAQDHGRWGDYPADPRQSTLYGWWLDRSERLMIIEELADKINADFEEIKKIHGRPGAYEGEVNYGAAGQFVNSLSGDLMRLTDTMADQAAILKDCRIPVSLRRFDEWYKMFLNLQSLRVVLIEIAIPLILGVVSLWLATKHILAS